MQRDAPAVGSKCAGFFVADAFREVKLAKLGKLYRLAIAEALVGGVASY